jgi:hypothetical protein
MGAAGRVSVRRAVTAVNAGEPREVQSVKRE